MNYNLGQNMDPFYKYEVEYLKKTDKRINASGLQLYKVHKQAKLNYNVQNAYLSGKTMEKKQGNYYCKIKDSGYVQEKEGGLSRRRHSEGFWEAGTKPIYHFKEFPFIIIH